MKKLVFLSVAMAAMMMLSCGGNTHQAEREEDTVDAYDQIRDHTLYGLCGAIPSTSLLKVITDVGDTLTLDITPALENRKMLGSVRVGDRLAVMTNKKQTEATEVININLLLGDWVMPDPLDGSDEIGIRIKEGGVAESIDQSVIVYRTWKIFNGELEIELMREGGGDEEEMNRYEILTLGPDTLAYKTLGKPRDETETFEYSRWKPKPKVDLHGLELEETNDEFNKI